MAGEREALTQQLDFHRATLLMKLDGLDDEQLRRQGTASGLSLLGLVKHLALVEHGWFVIDFAGFDEPDVYDPDNSFEITPDDTTDSVVSTYLTACERARDIVAKASLDDACTTPWGERANLRAILVHLIEETARHNGHADIIRESIDGTTGM